MHLKTLTKLWGGLVFYMTLSPLCFYTSSTMEVAAYVLFIASLWLNKYNIFRSDSSRDVIKTIILFVIAFVVPALIHVQTPFVTDVLQWISIILIVCMRNEYREMVLKYALTLFSIVLLVSIVEYIIGYVTGYSHIIYKTNSGDIPFTQSFANLYRYGNLQYRFSALASEPGELGATCGFILAFVPMNKKYLLHIIVSLIGGMLSLSLAFYLYAAFILLFQSIKRELSIKYLVVVLSVLLGFFTYFQDEIQSAIFSRVTETEHIDNRSSHQVNHYITHIFESTDGIYGVGNKTAYAMQSGSGEGNAGLKWKLFQYGIVGCGSYFLAMLLLYRKHRNKNVSYLFGIIFFLMYFYSVGMWGVPLYMLLLFTTLSNDNNEQRKLGL